MLNVLKTIFKFYFDWFRELTSFWKELWFWICVKIVIIVVLWVIFFPNILEKKFNNDKDKADFIWDNLLLNKDKN